MPCPFCVAVFEQADARYVNHMLAGHPTATLMAGAALSLAFLTYRDDQAKLVVAGLVIAGVALSYREWAGA